MIELLLAHIVLYAFAQDARPINKTEHGKGLDNDQGAVLDGDFEHHFPVARDDALVNDTFTEERKVRIQS